MAKKADAPPTNQPPALPPLPPGPRPAPEVPPTLSSVQLEAAVLLLCASRANDLAALLARPEKVEALRARIDRAMRNEEHRILEAPHNIASEQRRKNG